MNFFANWKRRAWARKLRAAIAADHYEKFNALLKTAPAATGAPEPLLHFVADLPDRARYIPALCAAGWSAALDALDRTGRAPLHIAVEAGAVENVRALLAAGANANVQDQDGVTPFNLSQSYHGLSDIAEALRGAGADPRILDKHGKNYLM
jgi:hypothetical protein